MHYIKYYFLIPVLFPLVLAGQDFNLKVGVECRSNVLVQRIDKWDYRFVDKNWSLDMQGGLGANVDVNFKLISFGLGLHYTSLGFNKNNPDSTHHFELIHGDQNPYYFKKLKYRANYLEVPLTFRYTFFTHKILRLNGGLSCSYNKLLDSSLKTSYHEANVNENTEPDVNETKKFLLDKTKDDWISLYPFFEFELQFNRISIAPKAGVRLFTKQYNGVLDKSWVLTGGLSFNYYLHEVKK